MTATSSLDTPTWSASAGGEYAMTADLAAIYRDAFTEVVEALDLPIAAFTAEDAHEAHILLRRRSNAVWSLAVSMKHRSDPDAIREAIDRFRARVDQMPVLYRRVIGAAADLPDDVAICGPGCCSAVLAVHGPVHDHCPGPRAGAEVRVR